MLFARGISVLMATLLLSVFGASRVYAFGDHIDVIYHDLQQEETRVQDEIDLLTGRRANEKENFKDAQGNEKDAKKRGGFFRRNFSPRKDDRIAAREAHAEAQGHDKAQELIKRAREKDKARLETLEKERLNLISDKATLESLCPGLTNCERRLERNKLRSRGLRSLPPPEQPRPAIQQGVTHFDQQVESCNRTHLEFAPGSTITYEGKANNARLTQGETDFIGQIQDQELREIAQLGHGLGAHTPWAHGMAKAAIQAALYKGEGGATQDPNMAANLKKFAKCVAKTLQSSYGVSQNATYSHGHATHDLDGNAQSGCIRPQNDFPQVDHLVTAADPLVAAVDPTLHPGRRLAARQPILLSPTQRAEADRDLDALLAHKDLQKKVAQLAEQHEGDGDNYTSPHAHHLAHALFNSHLPKQERYHYLARLGQDPDFHAWCKSNCDNHSSQLFTRLLNVAGQMSAIPPELPAGPVRRPSSSRLQVLDSSESSSSEDEASAKRTAAKQRVQARLQAKAAENASASGETTQNLEARIAKLQASLDNSGNYTAERKQALQGAIDSLKQKLQQKAEPVPPKTQSEAENKKPEAAKKQPADPLMADLVSEVDSHNERVNEGNKALKSKIGGPSFTAQLNPPPPPPPPPVGQGKDLSDNKAEEYADFLLGKTDYLKDVLKAPQSLSNKNAFLEYIENQNKYDPEKKKAELKKLFKAEPALRPFIDQALKDHPNWLQKRRQNNEP